MRLIVPGILLLVLAVAPRAQITALDPESLHVSQLLEYYRVPAVSVAVIRDFKIEWARAWGVRSVQGGERVAIDSLFQAASISKPVAAMASLRAVQDGRFSLDQDVNTILKSWRLPPRASGSTEVVTPRMLMSHMAGFELSFGFPGYLPASPLPSTVQILDGLPPSNSQPVRLDQPPMAISRYSNGGVVVQELALSDSLSKPFPQIVRDLVLDPIGMTNSTFEQPLPASRERQAAHAHNKAGQPHAVRWKVYPEHAAAGLWTTATDLAHFAIDVQLSLAGRPGRVLSRAMAEQMVTAVGNGRHGVGFALGMMMGGEVKGADVYFSHAGSSFGFRSALVAHRTKGYGIVVLTNGDNGAALAINLHHQIARAAAWDLFD
jgi:CubicO group peptidase (beta-lactamase class C family)